MLHIFGEGHVPSNLFNLRVRMQRCGEELPRAWTRQLSTAWANWWNPRDSGTDPTGQDLLDFLRDLAGLWACCPGAARFTDEMLYGAWYCMIEELHGTFPNFLTSYTPDMERAIFDMIRQLGRDSVIWVNLGPVRRMNGF